MKCETCRHWQGNRLSEWGDCYRVVTKLEPNLLSCYRIDENRPDVEFNFKIPFDPHDIEYWKHHPFFHKLYRNAVKIARETDGVRVDVNQWMFFQTHKEYTCES